MLQIHYIRVSFARSALFFARPAVFLVLGLALVALVACSSGGGGDDPPEKSSSGGNSSISSSSGGGGNSSGGGGNSSGGGGTSSEGGVSSSGGGSSGDINVENAIKIEFKGGSTPVITNTFSEVTITPTGENVVIRIPNAPDDKEPKYNFVISGTASNGSVKFYGDARKSLYLNGANITNSTGPAINIQGGKRVNVHLVGTQNLLSDAAGYKCKDFAEKEEQAKGAFFSEGKLEFEGDGSLAVKGKCNHAIAVDNGFEIKSGKINVSEAKGDGIHANDKIEVKGGDITIKSAGDAIQSEKAPDGPGDWVVFSGGTVNVQTSDIKSHGIASEGPVTISGDVNITIKVEGNGSKGIRSRSWVKFSGGKTSITTNGTTDKTDPTDESNSAGIKLASDLIFKGGELTITTTKEGAKGINAGITNKDGSSSGNANIEGGKINIDAYDDGLKVHGTLKITGGTGSIKSKSKKAIDAKEWDKNKGGITTQDGVS